MSIFSKLFGNKEMKGEQVKVVGGMEDFMTLIRVYYQSVLASQIGITNPNSLPDMAAFKRSLKIPTQNNKLGIAERSRCRKMLVEFYGLSDSFFKEIDQSIKRNCKNVNQVQGFLFMFQGFSNDLLMVVGSLMQWKLRLPSFMRGILRRMTEKTVHEVLTKVSFNDDSVHKTSLAIRKYQATLGYSQQWISEYVFTLLMLAKKEPKPKG